MRFYLPLFLSLGFSIAALVEDTVSEKKAPTTAIDAKHTELPFIEQSATSTEEEKFTIFNEVKVPTLKDLNGTVVTDEIKDGYWFVKHYSPYCHHCKAIAPVWQTLYEFYYV